MNNKFMISVLAVFSFSSCAVEVDNLYYGGNFNYIDYDTAGIADNGSLGSLTGRLGVRFNEYFSSELRAGFGINDDSQEILGEDVDIDLDYMYGAYLRAGFPVTDYMYPYAIVGYTRNKVSVSVDDIGSRDEIDSDASYGVGVDFPFSDAFSINLEYMQIYDKHGIEIDGLSFGMQSTF